MPFRGSVNAVIWRLVLLVGANIAFRGYVETPISNLVLIRGHLSSEFFFFEDFSSLGGPKIQYPRFNISPKGDICSNQQHKALYHHIKRSPKGDICSSQNTGLDIAVLEDPLKGIYRNGTLRCIKKQKRRQRLDDGLWDDHSLPQARGAKRRVIIIIIIIRRWWSRRRKRRRG